ncbi:peptidylprolyl isomerase [Nitratifractor sp.]|uniref:peptidylprolyl isomerase n=1 Tax=Nitratifractor sp. TaxID=2268144 RepID=UPI0025D66549|nr:peptidylprolyl isomerase [Nitratifractor sp.]
MIAWMQKHNKYLVITIWIATIAFIGAGFVGWGTYQYGSKAGAIARVGDVTISQEKFNFTYQNLYRQYAEMFKGNFDDAKAKKMGLDKEAYRRLVSQAMLLNLAQQYGVIVSDDELAEAIAHLPAFQTNGRFDKRVYETFLEARRIKAKTFESILREDLTIEKLMALLNQNAVPFEKSVVAAALSVSDKIRYQVLNPEKIDVEPTEADLKKLWESEKEKFMTPRHYTLALLWTDTSDINASEADLKTFYRKNSFDYTDAQGKELGFDKARARVERDYRIKKGKKKALLDYIAFKKGKKQPTETKNLPVGDKTLPAKLWKEIETTSPGDLIKPRPVGDRYVTVRIEKTTAPRPMSFDEAKEKVAAQWKAQAAEKAIAREAKTLLKTPQKLAKESSWIGLTKPVTLPPLTPVESQQFVQKLFTSGKKEGMIDLSGKKVLYSIVQQKFSDKEDNLTEMLVGRTADRIKKGEFEGSLLKTLYSKYPVKSFVKGF